MSSDVTREVDLPASPEEVWEQVTESDQLGEWLEADVELEPRPGGSGSFRFADGEVRRAPGPGRRPGRRPGVPGGAPPRGGAGRAATGGPTNQAPGGRGPPRAGGAIPPP